MKQKIFDALKTKFAGVKDEILDRIATKAAKTITSEEEVTTFVEGVEFQTILDAEGDRRATDAQKTAVANYEKKHNLKDGKPVEKPTGSGDDTTPAWTKAIIESINSLKAELAAIKGAKLADERKGKLDEVLVDVPDSIKAVYEGNYAAMQFADDDAFNAWLGTTKTTVESLVNDLKAKGAIVTPPKKGGVPPKGVVNPALKAQVEAQQKQNAAQSATILGLPQTN